MPEINVRVLPPAMWLPFFGHAKLLTKELAETSSARAKAIKVGLFLSPNVGRVVPILANERSGRAVLRAMEGRSNSKLYGFEIVWDEAAETPTATATPTPTAPAESGEEPVAPDHETVHRPAAPEMQQNRATPAEALIASGAGNSEAWA